MRDGSFLLLMSLGFILFTVWMLQHTHYSDEGYYGLRAVEFARDPSVLITNERGFAQAHPPLLAVMVGTWYRITGRISWTAGKWIVALIHMVATVALYDLVRRFASPYSKPYPDMAAGLAALMYVTNPIMVYFAPRMLTDTLITSFSIIGVWWFDRAHGGFGAWVSFVLAALSRNVGWYVSLIPALHRKGWFSRVTTALSVAVWSGLWMLHNRWTSGMAHSVAPTTLSLPSGVVAIGAIRYIALALQPHLVVLYIIAWHYYPIQRLKPYYKYIALYVLLMGFLYPLLAIEGAPPAALPRYYAPIVPFFILILTVTFAKIAGSMENKYRRSLLVLLACFIIGFDFFDGIEATIETAGTQPDVEAMSLVLRYAPEGAQIAAAGDVHRQLAFLSGRKVHPMPPGMAVLGDEYDHVVALEREHNDLFLYVNGTLIVCRGRAGCGDPSVVVESRAMQEMRWSLEYHEKHRWKPW